MLTEEEEFLIASVEKQENAAYTSVKVLSPENTLKLAKIARRLAGIIAEFKCAIEALTEENESLREIVEMDDTDE